MTDAPNLNALLATQIAAEDALLAQGLEVWSMADPATGEVVLHVTPKGQLPRGRMIKAGSSNLPTFAGLSPAGAAK